MPPRRALGIAVVESALIGVLAAAAGIGVLSWIGRLVAEVFPELGVEVVMSVGSIGTAVLVGVVAVSLAPLLNAPRLGRMDIPSTLRVVE